jgi:hypothetical protein
MQQTKSRFTIWRKTLSHHRNWIVSGMLANGWRIRISLLGLVVNKTSLAGIPVDELMLLGEKFAKDAGLDEHLDEFRKGALVSQNPKGKFLIDPC